MLILFDHNVPRPLSRHLYGHTVHTAAEMGWAERPDGALIGLAESNGYELLITGDGNIKDQQNLADRSLAVLVLLRNHWPSVRLQVDQIRAAIEEMAPGGYVEIPIPYID